MVSVMLTFAPPVSLLLAIVDPGAAGGVVPPFPLSGSVPPFGGVVGVVVGRGWRRIRRWERIGRAVLRLGRTRQPHYGSHQRQHRNNTQHR